VLRLRQHDDEISFYTKGRGEHKATAQPRSACSEPSDFLVPGAAHHWSGELRSNKLKNAVDDARDDGNDAKKPPPFEFPVVPSWYPTEHTHDDVEDASANPPTEPSKESY
jgi:hypothetical protein